MLKFMCLCLHLLSRWVAAGMPAEGEVSTLAASRKENVFPVMAVQSQCRKVLGSLVIPSGLLAVLMKWVV